MAPLSSSPGDITSTTTTNTESSPKSFSYFYLFLAAGFFALLLVILFFSHRRHIRKAKRKLEGQRALALDVTNWGESARGFGPEGWSRARYGRDMRVHRTEQDSDGNGEVPPSYDSVAADKPPSLRGLERWSGSVDGDRESEREAESYERRYGERDVELVDLPAHGTDGSRERREQRIETRSEMDAQTSDGNAAGGELQRPAPARVAGDSGRRWMVLGRFMRRDAAATEENAEMRKK